MPIQTLYVSGDNTLLYEFEDAIFAHHWNVFIREIKDRAAFNQSAFESGSITAAVHLDRASQWLDFVARFLQAFGSGLLPPDIKIAVNSTEQLLGRVETIW